MNQRKIWILLAAILAGTGCGQGNSDPKAEAPPPAQIEHEQDGSVVQVDHPEQVPLATATARSSRPERDVLWKCARGWAMRCRRASCS